MVIYSLTKYMNGHCDVLMGAAVLNDDETYEELKFLQNCKYFHFWLKCVIICACIIEKKRIKLFYGLLTARYYETLVCLRIEK